MKKEPNASAIASNQTATQDASLQADEPTTGQKEYAENFLAKFDANKDGAVIVAEVPRIVKDNSFNRIDTDGDGSITREELIAAARTKRGK